MITYDIENLFIELQKLIDKANTTDSFSDLDYIMDTFVSLMLAHNFTAYEAKETWDEMIKRG